MIKTKTILTILLLLYSIVILSIEFFISQDFVRNFLTDINGPVPFYAINTSLSSLLFVMTGVIFLVSYQLIEKTSNNKKEIWFYISQILIFIYLGIDDRFMIHERTKHNIGIDGDFIIAFFAATELLILIFLGNIRKRDLNTKISLLLAGCFTFIMLIFDNLIPEEMLFRLSIEDLSKTWAGFFLLLFSWNILSNNITKIRGISSLKEN